VGADFGVIASLLTAVLWAIAVILYRQVGRSMPPLILNLSKNIFAILIFIPAYIILVKTNAAVGDYSFVRTELLALSSRDWFTIAVSGVVGVAIAEVLFLECLNRVGAAMQAIIDCLYSPSVILAGYLVLGEIAPPEIFPGVMAVLVGVFLAGFEPPQGVAINRREKTIGFILGGISVILLGYAATMVKPLTETAGAMTVTLGRFLFGTLAMLIWVLLRYGFRGVKVAFTPQREWYMLLPGAFCGNVLATFFWIVGFHLTAAGRSAILNQTTSIFMIVFARVFLKEPITKLRVAAMAMAASGAAWVGWYWR